MLMDDGMSSFYVDEARYRLDHGEEVPEGFLRVQLEEGPEEMQRRWAFLCAPTTYTHSWEMMPELECVYVTNRSSSPLLYIHTLRAASLMQKCSRWL